jgi:hypothetical protein
VRRIHENSVKTEVLAMPGADLLRKNVEALTEPLKSEPGTPGPTYYGKDEPVAFDPAAEHAERRRAKIEVTRHILTVYEGFPDGLKKLTAEEILVQIRKIVEFDS